MIGRIALNRAGEVITVEHASEWFPLASASKVFIGIATAMAIRRAALHWDDIVPDASFDPQENSHTLYPHYHRISPPSLAMVTQAMIACHDGRCAEAIARKLGGWHAVQTEIASLTKDMKITHQAADEENNTGKLRTISAVLHGLLRDYQEDPKLWLPVIEGMVRQEDKVSGIPGYNLWNMTGGLPTALIDLGFIRHPSGEFVTYVIAGKSLPNRASHAEADDEAATWVRGLYSKFD